MRTTSAAAAAFALLLALSPTPGRARPAAEDVWSGRYAMELRLGSRTRVPAVGTERSVTRSLLLVDLRSTAAGWRQRHEVCAVDVRSDRITMRIPPAFVRAFSAREVGPVVASAAGEGAYRADLGVESLGFDPALTGGGLPRRARSRGVVDADRDGAPGVTVVAEIPVFGRVRLYVAQRSHLVLHGRRAADGRIEGEVEVRVLEQRTLGSSNLLFRRTLPIAADPATSGFTMVRAPGVTDCAALRRDEARIFE